MKSLFSVLIVLMVASANAQTQSQPTPPTTPAASPSLANPAPAPSQSLPTTPSATSATAADPGAAQVTSPEPTGDLTADGEVAIAPTDRALPSGILTNLGVTYFSRTLDETVNASIATDDRINVLAGELKVGYVFNFGLFAGATMHYDSGKATRASALGGASVKNTYAGPTVGYTDSYTGILATATYHVYGTSDIDTLGKYDKVNGFQFDVSYPMSITEKLKFGPQLTWRDLEQTEGDAGLGDNKTKELVPFMGVWYIF